MVLPEHFEEAVLEGERAPIEQALHLIVDGAVRRGGGFEEPRQLAGEVVVVRCQPVGPSVRARETERMVR